MNDEQIQQQLQEMVWDIGTENWDESSEMYWLLRAFAEPAGISEEEILQDLLMYHKLLVRKSCYDKVVALMKREHNRRTTEDDISALHKLREQFTSDDNYYGDPIEVIQEKQDLLKAVELALGRIEADLDFPRTSY